MSSAKSVTAEFAPITPTEHELDVTVTGEGKVDAEEPPTPTSGAISACRESSGECLATYLEGDEVTLIATADAGHVFVEWGGACSGSGSCVVTMSEAKAVTADFALNMRELSVSRAGTGSGAISSSPAGIACPGTCSAEYLEDEVVTLTASADAGSTFTNWSGACLGTGTCVVTLDEDRAVIANFDSVPIPPPPAKQCEDGVDNDGDGLIDYPADPGCSSSGDDSEADDATGTAFAAGQAKVRGGKALLRMRCRGGECAGVAKLFARVRTAGAARGSARRRARRTRNVLIGRSRYRIPAGQAKVVRIGLNRRGRALLRRAGRRGIKATLVGPRLHNRVVRLKPAGGARGRR